ncbi:MAG: ATP-binding protein [Fimbriimonadaceae bacterium]|nr:ATP-binding protein [Fimbriimonadaceae bacterium]
MDPLRNPFAPGAGNPPPELVGREEILDQGRLLLARCLQGRAEQSILMTGLRGVGKTVLLNELRKIADDLTFESVFIEAPEGKSLGDLLAPSLRSLLLKLDQRAGLSEKVKNALGVFRAFLGTPQVTIDKVTFAMAYEPIQGSADSGDLEHDLTSLFVAIAEAAKDRGTGIALFIDEVQYLSEIELSAVIVALHRLQQLQLPFAVVGCGLPTLPGLAGAAKSYAERLFSFPQIGSLSMSDSAKAVEEPLRREGIRIESEALEEVYRRTQGYPYFIQRWAYDTWRVAEKSPITATDVQNAERIVISKLDQDFFQVRFDRLTPSEKRYLRAMAELGVPCRSADLADKLGRRLTSLGPTRANLIKKGMAYSAQHGEMDFTVPMFGDFMKRKMEWSEELTS